MKSIDKNKIIGLLNKDISSAKVDSRILSLFLRQLSLLLDSGLGLNKSLKILEAQNFDKKLSKALHEVNKDLDQGLSIYEAFLRSKKSFNPLILAFIKSGDQSGNMAAVLDELASFLDEESKNKAIIKQAMTYPILLLFVTVAIVIIITSFVMPTFESVFAERGQILPLGTRILLGFSSFVKYYGLLVVIIIGLVILAIALMRKDKDFRYKSDKFLYRSAPFRKLRKLGFEYQFISLLYILRSGDVEILKSLEIIRDSFKNTYKRAIIERIIKDISIGQSFSTSLSKVGEFSAIMISMIKTGEDSSNMTEALKKTNDFYSTEYVFRLRKFSSNLEPVMIIVMSLIVAFVVFSIAIPIFDSVNAI